MRVCFTGHRQIERQYPPGGHWPAVTYRTLQLVEALSKAGYTEFISGGALGFDQVAAKTVIAAKNAGYQISLTMALPFPGFESRWLKESQYELAAIVGGADIMFYVNKGGYEPWKMFARNEWMVNNSQLAIALYGPDKPGGTLNCIHYAMTLFRPILKIHPTTQEVTSFMWQATKQKWKEEIFKL